MANKLRMALLFAGLILNSYLISDENSQILKENTIWSENTSIQNNIVIPKGITLSIQPGITISASISNAKIWLAGKLVLNDSTKKTITKVVDPVHIITDASEAELTLNNILFKSLNLTCKTGTFSILHLNHCYFFDKTNEPAPTIDIQFKKEADIHIRQLYFGNRVSFLPSGEMMEFKIKNCVFDKGSKISVLIIPFLYESDLHLRPIKFLDKNKTFENEVKIYKTIYCSQKDTKAYLDTIYRNITFRERSCCDSIFENAKILGKDNERF